MTVVASTNTDDSARVRSIWLLRAKTDTATQVERARECTGDGYRHIRADRERQIEGCRGSGRAHSLRTRLRGRDASLPGAVNSHEPGGLSYEARRDLVARPGGVARRLHAARPPGGRPRP